MTSVCFSSRRRHTRFDCDWSSDVCSSDLTMQPLSSTMRVHNLTSLGSERFDVLVIGGGVTGAGGGLDAVVRGYKVALVEKVDRSGEGRVGEEGRSPWSPDYLKKKKRERE